MLYDYLFYKGYQLAKKSKNWGDTPILFAIMAVGLCFILNFGALLFFIEGLLRKDDIRFGNFISLMDEYKYISGTIIAALLWWYYAYKGRGHRIIEKYEKKEQGKSIHPVIVIIAAYVLSLVLADIAAMYKNGDLF